MIATAEGKIESCKQAFSEVLGVLTNIIEVYTNLQKSRSRLNAQSGVVKTSYIAYSIEKGQVPLSSVGRARH